VEQRTVNRRYRIDRRIGEGARAVVYLGHDLLADRPVAVKALRPQLIADRATREQFGRDASVGAGLTHPNIVQILDFGEDAGTPYVVMEHLESETLQDVIRNEGPFGPDDVAGLLEQVAAGLDCAHERGIVHRNVTPWNVLVAQTGVVKLINVGRANGQSAPEQPRIANGPVPEHFVSPEQANGLPPTPSSDIYSLGIIAYEMLTGTLPFHASTPAEIASAHVRVPPPPPSLRMPEVPLSVDAAIFQALEKDPSRRFPTAGSFAAAIAAWNVRANPSPPLAIVAAEANDAELDAVPRTRGLRARMSRLVGLGFTL
jgi:eukaryotic-like serine/threonine-protein kinase